MTTNYISWLTNPDFWKKPRRFWLGLFILIVFAAILLFIMNSVLKFFPSEQIKSNNKSKASILNVAPLAQGKQFYSVVTDVSKSFKITEVEVDPLDVKKGETQIVTVKVEDLKDSPIAEGNNVGATVFQDNTSTQIPFSLKGTESTTMGVITTWQGSWVCQDYHDFRYTMTITAKSADSEHSIDLTFR